MLFKWNNNIPKPNVTVSSPDVGINTAMATAVLRPIYYGVNTATEPSAGVSTITLLII